jgi:type IV pilus biogenesis protein CpaD/CtpE
VIAVRGKRPALSAFAGAVIVLAQAAGCGSCVKDDPQSTSTDPNVRARKPITLKAVDQKLTQFGSVEGGTPDASTD